MAGFADGAVAASMKVPPKRKGNTTKNAISLKRLLSASMKVPPKRKGNGCGLELKTRGILGASMKVPPKRKGNAFMRSLTSLFFGGPQ